MRKFTNIFISVLLLAILSPLFSPLFTASGVALIAPNVAHAAEATITDESVLQSYGLQCFRADFWNMSIGECIAVLGYYMYVPTGWILLLSGALFDTFLAFSLSKGLLNEPFVSATWGTVRDFANLGLIFALLYIAIATILQVGGVQLKKAVANVIIVGLLINFSFFFTRVVIDVTNTIAFQFYTMAASAGGVSPSTGAEKHLNGDKTSDVTEYRISDGLMSGIGPQSLTSPTTFEEWMKRTKSGKVALFVVFAIAGIVNLVAAFVLFSAAFLFLGRILAFVFLIIASPLAFAAWALPAGGGGFHSKWWKQLLDQGLLAPIFLFFIYVIIKMGKVGGGYFANDITSVSFADFFIVNIVKASLIIAALMLALNTARGLSGKVGSLTAKWAGGDKTMRAAKSAAMGTAAFAARNTIGRGATAIAESERFKKFGDKNPTLGRWVKAGTDKVAGAGFGGRKGGYTASVKASTMAKEKFGQHLEKDKDGNTRTVDTKELDQNALKAGRQEYITVKRNAKDVYVDKLAGTKKEPKMVWDSYMQMMAPRLDDKGNVVMQSKDTAWARSSRKAAQNTRSGQTTKPSGQEAYEKMREDVKEGLKKEMESESGKTA